jgi:predicted ATP-binding protein involved in virulence
MELQKFVVEDLYGTFNHTIQFNNEERITIIIGQNGLGKTVILKMIKTFFDLNFIELKSYLFTKLEFHFLNGEVVKIQKKIVDDEIVLEFDHIKGGRKENSFLFKDSLRKKRFSKASRERDRDRLYYYTAIQHDLFPIKSRDYQTELDYWLERFLPDTYRRLGEGIWIDQYEKTFSAIALFEKFKTLFPPDFIERYEFPGWLRKFGKSSNTRIIETQRLLYKKTGSDDAKYTFSVVEFSQELLDKIKSLRAESSDLAIKLDRTYPTRLLEKIRDQEQVSSTEIAESLEDLERRRNFLNEVGLIDAEEQAIQQESLPELSENITNFLMLYIRDSNDKLSIYDDLAGKISLFLNIVNKRFLFKKLKIDKNRGFLFESTEVRRLPEAKKSPIGSEIPIQGLSSGEQHEIVLFYQLLFKTGDRSLFLIDEPEISLHISWQKQFIEDLKNIIRVNPIDIVIATHSPDIIGKYWELSNELDGKN